MIDQDALNELSNIKNIGTLAGPNIPPRYFEPWRGQIGSSAAIVFPTNVVQIQELIKWAKKHKARLVPQGARTGLVDASVPGIEDGPNCVIVSFEKYKNAITFNEADRRLIVDAGFLLSEVNEFLKPLGYFLPVNVSSDPMVCGMAATNPGGSSVLRHGDFRDLTMGIQVVLADDETTVYDTLQRPIKDNSSLDFTELFCGSFGELGMITSVALKVYPLELQTTTYWIPISEGVDISTLVIELEKISGEMLVACELVSSNVLEATASNFAQADSKVVVPYANDGVDVLFVEFATSSPNVDIEEKAQEIVGELAEKALLEDALNLDSAKTWDIRHNFSESVKNFARKLVTCDISVFKDKFSTLRSAIHKEIAEQFPQLVICDFGHVGDGGIHMNIAVPKTLSEQDFTDDDAKEVRRIVNELTQEFGGSFSAEHGLGALNIKYYESNTPDADRLLASRMKAMCDPDLVLGHPSINF
jgi:FAD/FMN-containing dehydrogenase